MELNRKAEVAFHFSAGDIEVTVERLGPEQWKFDVEDTSEIPAEQKRIVKTLTDSEASATLALFVGEMKEDDLNTALYEIAERAWKGVPLNLRIIP